jgi:hypothetical protein
MPPRKSKAPSETSGELRVKDAERIAARAT